MFIIKGDYCLILKGEVLAKEMNPSKVLDL
jgi:hypothetical protein